MAHSWRLSYRSRYIRDQERSATFHFVVYGFPYKIVCHIMLRLVYGGGPMIDCVIFEISVYRFCQYPSWLRKATTWKEEASHDEQNTGYCRPPGYPAEPVFA